MSDSVGWLVNSFTLTSPEGYAGYNYYAKTSYTSMYRTASYTRIRCPAGTYVGYCCRGVLEQKRLHFSANSITAVRTVLSTGLFLGFPRLVMSPPSIVATLLKLSPIFCLSSFRSSLSSGQSTGTCVTVSFAPHSHLSSLLSRWTLAFAWTQAWLVRSLRK